MRSTLFVFEGTHVELGFAHVKGAQHLNRAKEDDPRKDF